MSDSGEHQDYSGYYWGLPGNPRLLARSSRAPWERPPNDRSTRFEISPHKLVFVIEKHPLQAKLLNGLRDKIRAVLATMSPCKWIAVDYLRIGYEEVEDKNPVAVLVTVEKDTISPEEALRIADGISDECKKADLRGIEVEVMESSRQRIVSFREPAIPDPKQYPLVGASASIPSEDDNLHRCGTLAGYVLVDGKVMALTSHHVALGSKRIAPFPTENEEATNVSYTLLQPAECDLKYQIHLLKAKRKQILAIREARQDPGLDATDLSTVEAALNKLNLWTPEKCVLGNVWKTSGTRVRDADTPNRCCFDWALIELENAERFTERANLVNELPQIEMGTSYMANAFGTSRRKEPARMPLYLKRGLSSKEFWNKKDAAEERGAKYVVWKFGKRSHHTFGIVSPISTDHRQSDTIISEEVAIKNYNKGRTNYPFSEYGDSGSFVWDSDGYVCGLLWRGEDERFVSYMTPIEYVLEDIRLTCNAKEVKLVVRKEDEAGVVFGPQNPL